MSGRAPVRVAVAVRPGAAIRLELRPIRRRWRAFRHFVNDVRPDPELEHVRERGQRRPVLDHEREVPPGLATTAGVTTDGEEQR